MRKLLVSASAAMLLVSVPALAKNDKNPAPAPTPAPKPAPAPAKSKDPIACALADLTPGAIACSGFFAGNLLGNSDDKIAGQLAGLKSIGFDWNGNFGEVTKIDSLQGATSFSFGETMTDITYIGLHFGGGGPDGVGNGTAFYKLDLGSGLQNIMLKYQGSSGAVLYGTGIKPPAVDNGGIGNGGAAVPEPATWAMMIGGFGLLGAAIRRRCAASGTHAAA